jgi:hypothetical protein
MVDCHSSQLDCMPATDALTQAAGEIRSSDAVILVGAGASYAAGMPMAGQLSPLVWHTLDQHPSVRRCVAESLGVSDAAGKALVGDDTRAVHTAFRHIGTDAASRHSFQRAFSNLDRDRQRHASEAHDALAKLVCAGPVLRVVSLNWDSLLETAFERRYGIGINAQHRVLWKPHGDCRNLDSEWVLPSEDGFIPDDVLTDLEQLAMERPRVLLIVGYSGRDDTVIQRLVDPLTTRWRVFRLSPGATGEGAIPLTAIDGLKSLATMLCEGRHLLEGSEYVSFANQRGLEAAVSGERLGPGDAEACPRLPHFASAQKSLDLLNRVDIVGPPGCGKSITAWQLARERNRAGWHVLRLSPGPSIDEERLLNSLQDERWKRVIVVDDAQTVGDAFIRRLKDASGPRLAVITATTDATSEQPRSVRIPAQAAVGTLASEFRKRRNEVLPIVRRHDSHVGDQFMDTPLEWRIDQAAKGATPWEFAFVLRGGWSHAREQFNVLRDFERADLLLVLIAARQLLSCDAGVDVETIVADAEALGRPREWVLSTIEALRRQEAVLPGLPLRCLHVQAAIIVIETALKTREGDSFEPLVVALRRMVCDSHAPVRGIHWLNEHVLRAHGFLYARRDQNFYEAEALEALVQRLLKSDGARERRDAAFVLSRLLWYQQLEKERLRADFQTLRMWLESASGEDCYALGDLLNYVGATAPYDELVRFMDPAAVWRCLETLEPGTEYSWGRFLGRLAYAGGAEWRRRVAERAHQEKLLGLVGSVSVANVEGLAELVLGLASFDRALGMECLRQALPVLKEAYASNPLSAYRATSDLEHRLLGHPLFGPPRPSKLQRAISRELTEAIRPEAIASGITTCRFGDWEMYARLLSFVRLSNRQKHKAIVAAVPWDIMEKRCEPFWKQPPRELRLLLSYLAHSRTGEPVRSWVLRHSHLMDEIDPVLTGVSPEAAIEITKRGGRVNLAGHNQSDWRLQAWALASIVKVDTDTARAVLHANESHVVTRLSNLETTDAEECAEFIAVARELDPQWWQSVLRQIDLQAASVHWRRALEDDRSTVRRGAERTLRCLLQDGEGALRNLAKGVLTFARSSSRPARHRAQLKRVNAKP